MSIKDTKLMNADNFGKRQKHHGILKNSKDVQISPRLGQLLIEMGLITPSQLDIALKYQQVNGGRLGDILVTLKIITQEDFEKVVIPERQRTPLGKMLMNEGVITRQQLNEALEFQEKSGGL